MKKDAVAKINGRAESILKFLITNADLELNYGFKAFIIIKMKGNG